MKLLDIIMKLFYFILLLGVISSIILLVFKLTNKDENNNSSVVGYGYYKIDMEKYSKDDIQREWQKIINLAKTFPGFIGGKVMFPTTDLIILDGNSKRFVANVVAYGHWKTQQNDYKWVKTALHNGWGFDKLTPENKVHITMIER